MLNPRPKHTAIRPRTAQAGARRSVEDIRDRIRRESTVQPSHLSAAINAAMPWQGQPIAGVHLGFNAAVLAPDALSSIKEEAQLRAEARVLASTARDISVLTCSALEHELITRQKLEDILREHGAAGVPMISKLIGETIDAWSSNYVKDLGLPPSKAEDQLYVTFEGNALLVQAQFYTLIDASSLLKASSITRRRLGAAINKAGLPIAFAPDLMCNAYIWNDVMCSLHLDKPLTDDLLRKAWEDTLKFYDGDTGEEDGEQQIYGIGTFTDFEWSARILFNSQMAIWGKGICATDATVDARWRALAKRIEKLIPLESQWRFGLGEVPEGRGLYEAFVICVSPSDEGMTDNYFEMNADNGEMPSVCFSLNEPDAFMRAALLPKLAAGVVNLIAEAGRA